MWKYFFWWFGAGSDQYPCHLSCWINLIYHLNDLSAQFGRVTSNVNHFSFQNIRMMGMPFQTWLLDLKFHDRVTCFGNRIVMNCFSFRPGSWHHKCQPDDCIWKSTLHCIAFAMSLSSLSYGCVLILPLQFLHCASPLMTPSSPNRPNTKP